MRNAKRASDLRKTAVRGRTDREEARPIERILDRENGRLVGWLYEWNTGERMVMWKDGRREDVLYKPIYRSPSRSR